MAEDGSSSSDEDVSDRGRQQSRSPNTNAGSRVSASASASRPPAAPESKGADAEEDEEEEDAPSYTPKQLTSLIPPVSATMLLSSLIIVNVRSPDVDNLLSTSLGTYAVSNYIPTATTANGTGSSDDSDSFGFALLNAAVIIAGIALLTFGIVLCYKFKCYKFLYGFFTFTIFVALGACDACVRCVREFTLCFSCAPVHARCGGVFACTVSPICCASRVHTHPTPPVHAGFESGQILYAFFEKFQIAADWPSLVFVLYNFAVAGAVGILYVV
jgi:hypothetical protein